MKSASSPCLVLLWFFILSSHQHQSHTPHTKPYNSSKSTWKSSVKFQYLNFYSHGQISLQEICPRINYRWYLTSQTISQQTSCRASVKMQYHNFYAHVQVSLQKNRSCFIYRWQLTCYKIQLCNHIFSQILLFHNYQNI